MIADWGRETLGQLETAERREWLVTNGLGGYASGTLAGTLTRRYHGLLVAALAPPLGRTLLVAKLDEEVEYVGLRRALHTNRWADGVVGPEGYRELERFRLEGTTPVWTYAVADALLDKRVFMGLGANTTYVRYCFWRGTAPLTLIARALVNYRDHHGTTRAGGWQLRVTRVPAGVRVTAYDGARPYTVLAPGATVEPAHTWYYGFRLAAEEERGLEPIEDHLHAATIRAELRPGESLTVVLSAEAEPELDATGAWARRRDHEAALLDRWARAWPDVAPDAPAWIRQLVLAADQFVVRRLLPDDPDGLTVIAGYPWFGDWGRDTMIALPGLALATGRPEVARRVLGTFARFADRGMLPNRFPDAGEPPEYNTVDAALWFVEAVRAYHAATGDDGFLRAVAPVLHHIVGWYRRGTRYGIGEDSADGLLRAGAPGMQLTWMDARVGDWVVTPRTGKPVEIGALWYQAQVTLAAVARRLGEPCQPWRRAASRTRAGFARFWNAAAGWCYDVLDGPDGPDLTLRPNQLLAVALPASPLSLERRRRIVDVCARHLLTSHGLRSLAPGHRDYRGVYQGGPAARDAAYHQGTVWAWLLGPFALAHYGVYRDPAAAQAFLLPLGHQLADQGVGTLGEIFDGDPPFHPRGCIAQAWSVGETLRAWLHLERARRRAFGGPLDARRAARVECSASPAPGGRAAATP